MGTKRQNAKLLCGMLLDMVEDDAVEMITRAGLKSRVASRDGKPGTTVTDKDTQRINLVVMNDRVTEATVG